MNKRNAILRYLAWAAGLALVALAIWTFTRSKPISVSVTKVERGVDWSLVRTAADQNDVAIAITDRSGRIVCANSAHETMFGISATPPGLPVDAGDVTRLTAAGRAAWRDGQAEAHGISRDGRRINCDVIRAGAAEEDGQARERVEK